MNGGDDADSLFGDFGNDTVLGGAGDDLLRGYEGTDVIDGGTGALDKLSEQDGNNFVVNGFTVSSTFTGTETVLNIDRIQLSGTAGDDLIDARQASVKVILNGLDGNDSLLGSAFIDQLFGGNGNDVILGGAGSDVIDGGLGSDYFYEKGDANFTINATQVSSTPTGTETLTGFEFVVIVGGNSANTLNASAATLPVILLGGANNDTLTGGSGADVLVGGNRTNPSLGTDSLTGGLGADTFDNDPADTRVTDVSDFGAVANAFASLPGWIDTL